MRTRNGRVSRPLSHALAPKLTSSHSSTPTAAVAPGRVPHRGDAAADRLPLLPPRSPTCSYSTTPTASPSASHSSFGLFFRPVLPHLIWPLVPPLFPPRSWARDADFAMRQVRWLILPSRAVPHSDQCHAGLGGRHVPLCSASRAVPYSSGGGCCLSLSGGFCYECPCCMCACGVCATGGAGVIPHGGGRVCLSCCVPG